MAQDHRYILILAGGSGTRLYPASREQTPKHLTKIIGPETLLQKTFNRAAKVVPKDHIYISTNARYVDQVLAQIPTLSKKQIIAEPEKRNTAPAFAVGTTIISDYDPEAIIAAISCDHQILKEKNFVQTMTTGFEAIAEIPDAILAVEIQSEYPHLGYEYVEKGEPIWEKERQIVYKIKRFIERPTEKAIAEQYVAAGYYWNASYFIFKPKYFLSLVNRFLPEVSKGLAVIKKSIGTKSFDKVLKEEFLKFPDAQVDKSIMVNADNLVMLAADWGWSDIGSWDVVTDMIEEKKKDERGNYCEGNHIGIDSYNVAIVGEVGDKLVATIGLSNIVVVNTKDAILIMQKGRGQEVKKVVEEIKKRNLDHLL